ncbi:DUF6881 domain-containing protein [Burkholderia sp. BE17]|uniref:DUF6881 domain-containing protein n=1 Tax=Burkholderia sp. BE17 TaxID=2656644 RepID=UPI00128B2F09|nr:hypothetical protein [Burkholderia sp. BE17]MPV64341.1 hypothetical protein [Burkholderia sp. BE17]
MRIDWIAIDVLWKHAFAAEPIRLVSVLDRDRNEVRKLEFFRDGRVGFADETRSSLGTELGTVPVPPLVEINVDPEFEAQEITLEIFEALWIRHVTRIDHLD